MANTPSNMLPLGTLAPDFNLVDTVSDKILSLNDIKGEAATVIMFICNHCPFVIHVNEQLVTLANDYKKAFTVCSRKVSGPVSGFNFNRTKAIW